MPALDLEELADATAIPLDTLREKFKNIKIDENFDVDQFLVQIREELEQQDNSSAGDAAHEVLINPANEQIDDPELERQISEIMKNEKQDEVTGLGKISFKYKVVPKLDLGLTPEELLTLNESVLDMLVRNGRVYLPVYKRLKEDGYIQGDAFDLAGVTAYRGRYHPVKQHLRRRLDGIRRAARDAKRRRGGPRAQ